MERKRKIRVYRSLRDGFAVGAGMVIATGNPQNAVVGIVAATTSFVGREIIESQQGKRARRRRN